MTNARFWTSTHIAELASMAGFLLLVGTGVYATHCWRRRRGAASADQPWPAEGGGTRLEQLMTQAV